MNLQRVEQIEKDPILNVLHSMQSDQVKLA